MKTLITLLLFVLPLTAQSRKEQVIKLQQQVHQQILAGEVEHAALIVTGSVVGQKHIPTEGNQSWSELTVKVQQVVKGSGIKASQLILVRLPEGPTFNDVLDGKHPREEQLFLLFPDVFSTTAYVKKTPVGSFVVLVKDDIQPLNQLGAVKSLLKEN